MEKENRIMTSFTLAHYSDTVISSVAMGINLPGFSEVGLLSLIPEVNFGEAVIVKTAVTACLIGLYALTKKHNNRFAYSFEEALKISNVLTWGMTALNTLQVLPELLKNL